MRRMAIAVAAALLLAGCGSGDEGASLPQGSETVELDPADFTTEIDNPWWPMKPGSRWVYREFDSEGTEQRVVVTVTRETKVIANGIEARVVRDEVTEDGVPVEITDDWYAQDAEGNIWYLGEATTEYEDGEARARPDRSRPGSTVPNAGIVMPAEPRPGSPTARSTTPARRRTRRKSSASRSRRRCRSATSRTSS